VKHCPGEVCDLSRGRDKIQYLDLAQKSVFALSVLALFYIAFGGIIKFLIFGE